MAPERLLNPSDVDARSYLYALDRLASRLAWPQNDAAVWWDQYRDRNAVKEPAAPAAA